MHTGDGTLYRRPRAIEDALIRLSQQSPEEVLQRLPILDSNDSEFVPSECLLYMVRHPEFLNDEVAQKESFKQLRQRVQRAVPVRPRSIAGANIPGEMLTELDVRDAVLDKFHDLLLSDRTEYDERLDFYECRFNKALDALRADARKPIFREESKRSSVQADDIPIEEIESAVTRMRSPGEEEIDFLYRSKLLRAIHLLPPDERRVIELYYLEDLPIESADDGDMSIVKILGCVEKTVRNRRDRGLQRLYAALKEECD
jgi:hypothetical protein